MNVTLASYKCAPMYSKHNFLQYATEWGIYRTKEIRNKTKNDVFYVSVSSAHSHYAVNDLTLTIRFLKADTKSRYFLLYGPRIDPVERLAEMPHSEQLPRISKAQNSQFEKYNLNRHMTLSSRRVLSAQKFFT